MKAQVQMLNENGRPVPNRERSKLATYRGQLRIHESRSGALGRITPVAELVSATDGTQLPLVPSLHDAAVLFLRDGQLRIRGFEVVDGVQFGQTWDVRVD